MSLTDDLADMRKEIFFTDLLASEKKECNNLLDEFDNTKERVIDFVNMQIIKII